MMVSNINIPCARAYGMQNNNQQPNYMALGFSGSNGGVRYKNSIPFNLSSLNNIGDEEFRRTFPYEVSYFVNSVCNLRCAYCYVGYHTRPDNALSVEEWKRVFNESLNCDALTFGNVGKEPLVSKDTTLELMRYLQRRRSVNHRIRYGLVTNATLMTDEIIDGLYSVGPDWIDVSIDGPRRIHDVLRGKGNFDRTVTNISRLPKELRERVFILCTATSKNIGTFSELLEELGSLGFTKFMVSPFAEVSNENSSHNQSLKLSDSDFDGLLEAVLGFENMGGIEIVIKTDPVTTQYSIDYLIQRGFIDTENLLIDDYGVIFSKTGSVLFNYIPFDDKLIRQVRITDDGMVGGCYDMFFQDKTRFVGNVRTTSMSDILQKYRFKP